MSSKLKIVLNREAVRGLLRSQEILDICEKHASQAQSRLGAGYEVNTHIGKNRVNAAIVATTYEAKKENAKNNTILKALGGSK